MELELRQETVRGWETVCRTTLEQEETAEAIVPDARPDIWQVLDGQARLLFQRNEAQEGRGAGRPAENHHPLSARGRPGVEAMEVTLPFSAAPDLPQLTRRGTVHVVPRVLSVDVHLLNPRKVLVRVGYCLDLEAFEPQNRSLAAQAKRPRAVGVCQKTGQPHLADGVCPGEGLYVSRHPYPSRRPARRRGSAADPGQVYLHRGPGHRHQAGL